MIWDRIDEEKITKIISNKMKTRSLLLMALTLVLSASCDLLSQNEEDFGEADIQVNPTTLSFDQGVSSRTVTILATRPWQAEFSESWIAVDPAKGPASMSEQEVTITVLENNSVERTGKIVFNAGIVSTSLTLTQPGDGSQGNGSAESPYTVNAAMEIISGMNSSDSKTVYVKGKVSKLGEFGGSYGNYTYYISDTDSTGTNLEVYRGYGLNKAKFTSADDLKLGDEVVVYGDVVNFKGNTPEFTSGSQLVYLNGQTAPIVEDTPGTPEGNGSAESPFNVAAAIAKCQEIGTTASTDKYYVKGIVTGSNGIDASWGNATFYIKDANATATFYIYRCFSFDGAQFTSTDVFKEGDEVVVCGPLVNYQGNTPEMTTGGSLITVNGAGAPEPVVGPAEGSGTAESPFNVSAAIAKAKETGETETTDSYYVKGTIKGSIDLSATNGNVSFNITDGGETTAVFRIFRAVGFGGAAMVGDEIIKEGDEVVICGKIVNYQGKTPETAQGASFVSINGKTEFERKETEPVTGDAAEFTSNISFSAGTNAYTEKATVNGIADVVVYKLGKSSAAGEATVTIPAGTKSISFYGVSWKAKEATLDIKIGGSSVYTQALAANEGASNNSPYTLTVTSSDKYTYAFDTALTEAVTATVTTSGTNTRIILFGIQAAK